MLVYRITQTKYANTLNPPGVAARWNSAGVRVLYTGGSLALSCLESLAHKNGASITAGDFSVSIINIDASISIMEISIAELELLDQHWAAVVNYPITQALGDKWVREGASAVLKVPSAIIDLEYNYLINPDHPAFARIGISSTSKFAFDPRLKATP